MLTAAELLLCYLQVQDFITQLKRRKARGSSLVAMMTAELLRNMIGTCRFANEDVLREKIREMGYYMLVYI